MESHVKVIEEIAREYQFPFSDVYKHTKDRKDWLVDGAHPNKIGAYEIAKCLSKSFTEYINGSLHCPVNYSTSTPTESSSSVGITNSPLFWAFSLVAIILLQKRKLYHQ